MTQQATASPEYYAELRENLVRYFDEEELRTLSFDIGVDYEELQGAGKRAKARELITYLIRCGCIHNLIRRCSQLRPNIAWGQTIPESGSTTQFTAPVGNLCEHIKNAPPIQKGLTNWKFLEEILVRAVVMGGVAAMAYYRQPLPQLLELVQEGKEKNPSTQADLLATARILETVNSALSSAISSTKLDCKLSYLGEETKFITWFQEHVRKDIPEQVLPIEAFFSPYCEHGRLRVLVDGIDGTGSFVRGIPLFCSAAAILVEDEPRVSAVYDPIHHIVYSALLLGPHGKAEEETEAWAWEISTGNRTNLVELARSTEKEPEKQLKREAVGIHLTRTNAQKLEEFLQPTTKHSRSTLESLARASGAIYAVNSGTLAMAEVATGALAGFVNNTTNLWDIAAGEVLVRACRGKVTTFEGASIKYSDNYQPSIVAANKCFHSKILDVLNE